MRIRKMSENDLDAVVNLEQQIFSSPWSRESIEKAYLLEENIYLVAENEGQIIGYCGIWTSFETADLCNIAVRTQYRRRGVGNEILKKAFALCHDRRIQQMLLEVRESNNSAISLYKKNGFESINIRKAYYKQPVENAIIMQRSF